MPGFLSRWFNGSPRSEASRPARPAPSRPQGPAPSDTAAAIDYWLQQAHADPRTGMRKLHETLTSVKKSGTADAATISALKRVIEDPPVKALEVQSGWSLDGRPDPTMTLHPRREAVEALCKTAGASEAAFLARWLQDEDHVTTYMIGNLLADTHDMAFLDVFVSALTHPSKTTRYAASRGLRGLGSAAAAAIPAVREAYAAADPRDRIGLAETLQALGVTRTADEELGDAIAAFAEWQRVDMAGGWMARKDLAKSIDRLASSAQREQLMAFLNREADADVAKILRATIARL